MSTQTEPLGSVPDRAPGTRKTSPRATPNLALLQARTRLGLSREELGHLAGITGKQVGLIERGLAKHSRPETLAAIANALEVDIFKLFPARRRPVQRRPRRTTQTRATA